MADFKGIKNGSTYLDCKDATARSSISTIEGMIPSSASASNKLVTASEFPAFTVSGETLIFGAPSAE